MSSLTIMNNAAFGIMQNTNSLMGLTRNAGNFTGKNLSYLNNAEKRLTMDNLQNQFTYQAADAMQDSEKKIQKDKIKRSFDTFA